MDPKKLSVLNLFNDSRRYVVPLYQRAYVWTEERQWEPLWRDVRKRAEAHLAAQDGTNRDELPSHFLGAIVLEPQRVGMRQVRADDVIDGQQRLTTLQVFLAAFRDLVGEVDQTIHSELEKATQNTGMMESEVERFKVWPTNFDRDSFSHVMDAGSREETQKVADRAKEKWRPVPRLVDAYLFFANSIDAWLHARDEEAEYAIDATPAQRASSLYFALRDSLQVVAISLEKGDDPQVIFETLNARGEPLLASDLVRNFVFTAANREKLNADRLYERYWRPFDGNASRGDMYWRGEVRVGRERHSRLVLFFYHFLTYKLAEDLSFATVFSAFKRWWVGRTNGSDVEAGLQELETASAAYRRILEPSADDRFGVFAHRLQALDVTTLHPLLLFLQLEAELENDELDAIATDLESLLIRRGVCGLTSKNYNRLFLNLIEVLRSADRVDRETVSSHLRTGTGDSVRWPGDREFEAAWLARPIYRRSRKITGPVLQAIDAQLMTGMQEELHLRKNPTVEHVLPRAWRQNWPEPAAEEATSEESPDEVRDRLLHTFGNLTLLTGALNSTVSNAKFDLKRPQIAKQSALRLNTYFQEQPTWDETIIRQRGAVLFEVAREVWPGPARTERSEEDLEVPDRGDQKRSAIERTEPSVRLEEIYERVRSSLPPELKAGNQRKGYFQIVHEQWPSTVHYEVRVTQTQVFCELHIEESQKSEIRERLVAAVSPLQQRLEDIGVRHEITVRERTWLWMGYELPIGASADEVVEALQLVVMATRGTLAEFFATEGDSAA